MVQRKVNGVSFSLTKGLTLRTMMSMAKIQNRSNKDDAITAAIPRACQDEQAAVEFFERQRFGDRPFCAYCGSENVYKMMDSKDPTKRQAKFRWRCREKLCHQQFTVRK